MYSTYICWPPMKLPRAVSARFTFTHMKLHSARSSGSVFAVETAAACARAVAALGLAASGPSADAATPAMPSALARRMNSRRPTVPSA